MNESRPTGAGGREPLFRLCLVTDRQRLPGPELAAAVQAAVAGGADAVELREKDLSGRELLKLGRELDRAISGRARLLVNDRAEVALAIAGAGLHLPANGLPVAAARELIGPDRLLGKSVHDLGEARAAQDQGADYVFFGPVFETSSKPGRPAQGLGRLRELCSILSIPVCAIGGVTPERVRELKAAGAGALAAISFMLDHPDPERAARELALAWSEGS